MNIFISENSEKDEIFDKLLDILDVSKLKQEIKAVFKKAYNNYVGYYLFKDGKEFFKIFVLPKNISLPKENDKNDEIKTIKQFLNYLKEYYRLQDSYLNYKTSNLNIQSLLELSFNSHNSQNQAQNIEQFIFYKYKVVIQEIIGFFKLHKAHKRIKNNYVSQTIKYKINLAKNLKEIDKTKIHQDRLEDIIYSQVATIAYGAIKLFIQQKVELFEDINQKDEVLKLSLKLQSILLKKYNLDNSFNLSLFKLVSNKINKFFRKKQSHQLLYSHLLTLFGFEHFFDEESAKEINRNIESDSLFFRPEIMYEWFVYDYLIKQNQFGATKENASIQSKKDYYLKIDKKLKVLESKPDIIIESEKKIIIDVKWKQINSDSFSSNDILKLQRDYEVHKENDTDEAYIIYLSLDKEYTNQIKILYAKDEIFKFKVLEIGMNL